MMDAGRLDDAAAFARRSVEADASRYMSHFLLGVIAQQRGRCDEAIGHFEGAIEAKRLEPHAVVRKLHAGLADCLARAGRDSRRRARVSRPSSRRSVDSAGGDASVWRRCTSRRDAKPRHAR